MSNFKPLVIGDLKIEKPVIQGGMGVGISLHRLAGAVAKEYSSTPRLSGVEQEPS